MKNRYSLRKLSVGLCSVVLGCMLLQNATTQEVKADAGTTEATQAQSAGSTSDGTATGKSGSNLVVMKHALLMKVNKFKDWKLLIIKKKL